MLRILLAEDHPAVRRSIRGLVESRPGFSVVAEAADGSDAVALAERVRPDVAILDISMPVLNGLEACVQIRQRCPFTEIIFMTGHRMSNLEQKAQAAGASAVVIKDEADTQLVAALQPLDKHVPVHVGGTRVGSRHIAAFFASSADRYRVLAPFVAEGLDRGEKAFHIIDPPGRDLHLNGLRQEGVAVDEPLLTGQLELKGWEDIYFLAGRFDRHRMMQTIHDVFTAADSYDGPVRLIAHMEWALEEYPGVEDLIEFESRLNEMLPKYRDVAICAYDSTRFGSQTILDVVRSHPAVIIGGVLVENSLYTPTEQLVAQIAARPSS